jgi:isocitrate dehydrogenase kinase/phosphatase
VFKVIRDWFEPPKQSDRKAVEGKYLMVKYHDRVGRLADTLEYSYVALPASRFAPAVVDELRRVARSSIEMDGDKLVIRHVYIERRMVPLDIYIRNADGPRLRHCVNEYGVAVKELAGANIFPGDMLLKNFGVTRYGRVVFYDYDEIGLLTDYNFRRMPTPSSDDEEGGAEPWFSVGPTDVFPEELPKFLFSEGGGREEFLSMHGDLADPAFWIGAQERIRANIQDDVFPYPQEERFRNRPGGSSARWPAAQEPASVPSSALR